MGAGIKTIFDIWNNLCFAFRKQKFVLFSPTFNSYVCRICQSSKPTQKKSCQCLWNNSFCIINRNIYAIDFEYVYPSDREAYNRFLEKVSNRIKALRNKLFGKYKAHRNCERVFGDYLAIARSNTMLSIRTEKSNFVMKAAHSGFTDEEIKVPLIVYENPKSEF